MLHNGVYSKINEKVVVEVERDWVETAMEYWAEYIIVDNTHLWTHNQHVEFYRDLAKIYEYDFEVKDFYVSVEEAIKRDNLRAEGDKVGEAVIRRLAKYAANWGYPTNPEYKVKPQYFGTYIVDIDWTLAWMKDKRSPYDFSKISGDEPNKFLINLMNNLVCGDNDIIILSWREDSCRKETEKWLDDNKVPYKELFMRKAWDNRKDAVVKKEIYENEIKDRYNVVGVFDDREDVVRMWRLELGIPTYAVRYWNF